MTFIYNVRAETRGQGTALLTSARNVTQLEFFTALFMPENTYKIAVNIVSEMQILMSRTINKYGI